MKHEFFAVVKIITEVKDGEIVIRPGVPNLVASLPGYEYSETSEEEYHSKVKRISNCVKNEYYKDKRTA